MCTEFFEHVQKLAEVCDEYNRLATDTRWNNSNMKDHILQNIFHHAKAGRTETRFPVLTSESADKQRQLIAMGFKVEVIAKQKEETVSDATIPDPGAFIPFDPQNIEYRTIYYDTIQVSWEKQKEQNNG